jgi:hypothetical protein
MPLIASGRCCKYILRGGHDKLVDDLAIDTDVPLEYTLTLKPTAHHVDRLTRFYPSTGGELIVIKRHTADPQHRQDTLPIAARCHRVSLLAVGSGARPDSARQIA